MIDRGLTKGMLCIVPRVGKSRVSTGDQTTYMHCIILRVEESRVFDRVLA